MIPVLNLGVVLGLSAYVLWGILPIYFKWLMAEVPLDIVANRVLWSMLFLAVIISFMAKWRLVSVVFKSPKLLLTLGVTTCLIATNWSVFVYSVSVNKMLDASLGYYINPFVSIVLGMIFFQERLSRLQTVALLLALIGVGIQIFAIGYLPWISLVLALSFGFYGMLHKHTPTDSFTSLFIETVLLLPFALLFMGYLYQQGEGPATRDLSTWGLLMIAGPATTIPLLLFSAASKKVPLATLGFMQYLSPSMVFLLAVFVYGEPFDAEKGVTFAFIWSAIVIFIIDALSRKHRLHRRIKANSVTPSQ